MRKICLYFTTFVVLCLNGKAQRIGNYVSNGSFEQYYTCSPNTYLMVKNWTNVDSSCISLGIFPIFFSTCNGTVPQGCCDVFQYPRSGEIYTYLRLYGSSSSTSLNRTYTKNRMKATLQAGKTYCVKFYVNIWNGSRHGIDGFAAYFGGSEIDTVTHCNLSLTYITPQVQNPHNNIIKDTLNWTLITGTFTANGTEKYLLLGNFLSDANTDTLLINSNYAPMPISEAGIDDVSCIEVNLPAYAGRDTTIQIGDSVYIGRENDFALDSGCVWYKLPNTTTAIDTTSGFWIKPALGTHTYVVRQELECSSLKWDTVVVTVIKDVGIKKYQINNLQVELYPNPASGILNTECKNTNEKQIEVSMYDFLGKELNVESLNLKEGKAQIDVSDLENGIYTFKITNSKKISAVKKMVIAK